jgi:hypothetical protein
MAVETTVRDMLLATWGVEPGRVARMLPTAVEPALDEDGRALVSLVALRNTRVRVGRFRVPSWRQVAVRTYVEHADGDGVFLLGVRVSSAGLGGLRYGVPVRPARVRVSTGKVVAPGLGAVLRYRVGEPSVHVPAAGGVALGSHTVAYFLAAGLRRLRSGHAPPAWRRAELLETPRLDPVLALGFDVREPDSLLYAERVAFRVELPPEQVADSTA